MTSMEPLTTDDPDRLGRYQMLAVIGRGGMGQVLLGRAPDGRLIAVKQIHRNLTGSPEFRARFHREVVASQQVTGAYTAGVVDADADAESPWLASEYIAGPSLQEAVARYGAFTPGALKLLLTGLAMALLEIHRTGLVHRDLKPSNVLLTNDGPRVIDFGIARAMEDDVALTATGAVIGSPAVHVAGAGRMPTAHRGERCVLARGHPGHGRDRREPVPGCLDTTDPLQRPLHHS